MRYSGKSIVGLALIIVLCIGACSAPGSQNVPARSQSTATVALPDSSSYGDPFAYCAAVGMIDVPDARYTGPAMPDSIIQGLIQQGIVSADAPVEFQQHAVWRCMDGQVWACHFGANLPCQEKADTGQTPTAEMNGFCEANPTAEIIPAVVTGRATVYEWKCNTGKPQVVRQVLHVDAQGYLADFWYELSSK